MSASDFLDQSILGFKVEHHQYARDAGMLGNPVEGQFAQAQRSDAIHGREQDLATTFLAADLAFIRCCTGNCH